MKFKFVISGKLFELEDLGNDMNNAFINLHAAYLANHIFSFEDFENKAFKFFSKYKTDNKRHDSFFNNFTIVWQNFLNGRRYGEAEEIWKMALKPAFSWEEQNKDKFIHKGTALYFWGMTAILKGDIDKGYALMHRAVSEDIRTSPKEFRELPGFAFATINYQKVDQAFREWVLIQANFLDSLIADYCSSFNKKLNLEEFRNSFLANHNKIETVFLFTYALAKLINIHTVPNYAMESDFASQLIMNLFLDIIIVIDAAIKEKNQGGQYFINHLIFLSEKTKLKINQREFQEINREQKTDCERTINRILTGGYDLSGIERDIAIAYALRNQLSHNVSSLPVIRQNFLQIQQSLFNVLFLAVEELYS